MDGGAWNYIDRWAEQTMKGEADNTFSLGKLIMIVADSMPE